MSSPSTDITDNLVIQENTQFSIDQFQVEVESSLGLLTAGVHYFKVNICQLDADPNIKKSGLLRVGSAEGALKRELQLRKLLTDIKLIAEILAHIEKPVTINLPSSHISKAKLEGENNNLQIPDEKVNALADSAETVPENESNTENTSEVSDIALPTTNESEYLEEEYLPEKEITADLGDRQLLLLTEFPDKEKTLETWLTQDHSLEETLSLSSQVCQFFRYTFQKNWCFVHISPQLIQIGTPIKIFDLTGAYPSGEKLPSGLLDGYCAPELSSGSPINELMSSYTVGALLYQLIHKQLPSHDTIKLQIKPTPRVYQILSICLSHIAEERFPLSQLLSLLVETRQSLRSTKIHWNVASRSTVGLSTNRLQNEDNYGIRQLQLSNSETLILGVVADGMGGMSQGEIASQLAVKTVLEEPITTELKTIEQRSEWLKDLVQKANEAVSSHVKEGGTTLSLVLAIAQDLMIAHVGDSRIYLLRKGEIRQLSEDHSFVAMQVASGQITKEESLEHPDRNVLIKSLGSKRRLSDGYVQDLSRTTEGLSMALEDGDILLLCSDGVWDLIPNEELETTFTNPKSLQDAVNKIIDRVLERGAPDNATLLALECRLDRSY